MTIPVQLPEPSASAIPVRSNSAFRDLLEALRLRGVDAILDVGAGGFCGETTTTHLVDLFDAEIVGVEIDVERAAKLADRFGSRVEVVAQDIEQWQTDRRFDIVVLDIDTPRIPAIFERMLDGWVAERLAPNGVVISVILMDAEQAFHGPKALPLASEQLHTDFLDRFFGARVLDDAVVRSRFEQHRSLRALTIVEKWRDDPANLVGWLALQGRDSE